MSTKPAFFLSVLTILLLLGSSSCDLINPEEQIPAFICVDSFNILPAAGQGTEMHNIVDAWVYDNEQLVGIYELPAVVPILTTGDANIRIRPGIKLNGQVATRSVYQFVEDFSGTVELFEDSIVCVNPSLPFRTTTSTPWLEDFELPAQVSISSTTLSEESLTIISGQEAFDGNSALLHLPADKNIFECKSNASYDLPSGGATVLLEFSYKCNHPFIVSMFSGNSGGSVQTPIISLNPTDEWKHIYVSLTETASTIFQANAHEPAFGFVRNGTVDGDINVYLDNIRLTYFEL